MPQITHEAGLLLPILTKPVCSKGRSKKMRLPTHLFGATSCHVVHNRTCGSWILFGDAPAAPAPSTATPLADALDPGPNIWIEANNVFEILLSVLDTGRGTLTAFKRKCRAGGMADRVSCIDIRRRGVFHIVSRIIDKDIYIALTLAERRVPAEQQGEQYRALVRECKLYEKAFFDRVQNTSDLKALLTSLVDPTAAYPEWFSDLAIGLDNPIHLVIQGLSPQQKSVILQYAQDRWAPVLWGAMCIQSLVYAMSVLVDVYVVCKMLSDQQKDRVRCILMGEHHIRGILACLRALDEPLATSFTVLPGTDGIMDLSHPQDTLQIPSVLFAGFHEERKKCKTRTPMFMDGAPPAAPSADTQACFGPCHLRLCPSRNRAGCFR